MGAGVRQLNPEQQQAVTGRANMVVTASAGTGKTAVLVERYLRLVADGVPVNEILALTFTRKAAAEMRDRIVGELIRRADLGDAAGGQSLERIRIGTIDSFCLEVIRQDPGALGLPPELSMLEEGDDERILEFARNFILANADDPGIAEWARDRSLDDVLSLGLLPLARSRPLSRVPDEQDLLEHDDAEVSARAGELKTIAAGALKHIRHLLAEHQHQSKAWATASRHFPRVEADLAAAGDIVQVLQVLAAAGMSQRMGGTTAEPLLLLKEQIRIWKTAVTDPATELLVDAMNRNRRAAVYGLLARFLGEYAAFRQEQGLLGFQDLLPLALDLLLKREDLLSRVRDGISAVLIDEFQDNNALQRDLLYLLGGRATIVSRIPTTDELRPDRLFFVGDAKQSIYRFRGADVSVFNGLTRELAEQAGASIRLTRTYRLSPDLVAFTNRVFSRVFPAEPRDWDTGFDPAVSGITDGAASEGGPCVRLLLGVRTGDRESDRWEQTDEEAEAAVLALKEETASRGIPYGQCAILLPTYGQQYAWERALRRHRIPFSAAVDRSLLQEAPAHDLCALLRCIAGPRDAYAWAVLLRSPFAALRPATVAALMKAGPETTVDALPSGLDSADEARIRELLHRMHELRTAALSATELLDRAWFDLGYRWFVLQRQDLHPYLGSFHTLRTQARLFAGRGVRAFLDWLERELAGGNRLDGDEEPGIGNAVSILSIHKAKGLEYRLVVVGGLGTAGSLSEKNLCQDSRGRIRVKLGTPPGFLWSQAERQERDSAIAEIRRKLYVALTRAKEGLILSGYLGGNQKEIPENSYLYHLLSALQLPLSRDELAAAVANGPVTIPDAPEVLPAAIAPQYGIRRTQQLVRDDTVAELAAARPAELRAFPHAFPATALQKLHDDIRYAAGEIPEPGGMAAEPGLPTDDGSTGMATVVGTLAHQMFDSMIQEQLGLRARLHADQSGSQGSDEDEWAEQVSPEIREALRIMEEAYRQSELPELLSTMELVELELPALGALNLPDGQRWLVRGQLDCIGFSGPRVVIVDFKTDAALWQESYRLQLSLYAAFAPFLRPPPTPDAADGTAERGPRAAQVELYRYAARSGRLDRVLPYAPDGELQQVLQRIAESFPGYQTR